MKRILSYVEYMANRRRMRRWLAERDCETGLHVFGKWGDPGFGLQTRACLSCGVAQWRDVARESAQAQIAAERVR